MSNFVIAADWDAGGPQRGESAKNITLDALSSLAPGASSVSRFLAELLADTVPVPAPAAEGVSAVAWLDDVYSLVARQRIDEALDVVFRRFDELLTAGEWPKCDSVLRALDVQRLDTHLLVGVLSATLPAKADLTARKKFAERTERRLRLVAPDRAERLLIGLR